MTSDNLEDATGSTKDMPSANVEKSEARQRGVGEQEKAKDGMERKEQIVSSVGMARRDCSPRIRKLRRVLGLMIASTIATLYYVVPFTGTVLLVMSLFRPWPYMLYFLMFVAAGFGPVWRDDRVRTSWLVSCLADYFDVEVVTEMSDEEYLQNHKKYLMLNFPHGVMSLGGIAGASICDRDSSFYGPTAVADALLRVPVLRQFFACFGMVGSSRESILKSLKTNNVFIYPGGVAEMFLTNFETEELYFDNRKGCIRVAMEAGADLLPCYILGNTMHLKLLRGQKAQWISRTLRAGFTAFWGMYYLPLPFPTKVYFVVGRPVKLPDCRLRPDGTQPLIKDEDVNKAHAAVKEEIERLFNKYKQRHPDYKHKTLIWH